MEIWNHSYTFNTRTTTCAFYDCLKYYDFGIIWIRFATERSEPMLKIKIYHLQQSE